MYNSLEKKDQKPLVNETLESQNQELALKKVKMDGNIDELNKNFINASKKASDAVVFIKAIKEGNSGSYTYWDLFFNYFGNSGPQVSSGSGVIISEDGYIVTNHHVIKDANRIEIVVNHKKKSYPATIVGVAQSSDLALLKIDATHLPYAEPGNSDNLEVGEWVIAIGNPFNLTSTVTAGIVSAKGRNINILNKDNFPIESFIQTDAAINPGNSGGALINTSGQLVGINTAILSKTGSYAGYGFAIPSNIVFKIVDDFKNYGIIQRAFIEVEILDIDEELAEKLKDEDLYGVYISKIYSNGNAERAGLKKGDVILKLDNHKIINRAAYDEQLAYHRPGDQINVEVLRNNHILEFKLILINSEGTADILKETWVESKVLGASFKALSKTDKNYYGIDYGIKVKNVHGGLFQQMGITDGFIILSVNDVKFDSADKLVSELERFRGRVYIKGVTPEGWIVTRSIRIY